MRAMLPIEQSNGAATVTPGSDESSRCRPIRAMTRQARGVKRAERNHAGSVCRAFACALAGRGMSHRQMPQA